LQEFRDLLSEYHSLIDGGNTEQLLSDLATSEDEIQRYLVADLVSPYLSARSLEAIINNDWLGEDNLQQLIYNNPALVNNATMEDYLVSILDEGIVASFLNNVLESLGSDDRFQMESTLNLMGNELNRINRARIDEVYLDSLGYSANELQNARLNKLNVRQYYSAVMAYWEAGNEEAWSMLESLPYEFQLSEPQEYELYGVQNYMSFLEDLRDTEKSINQLNQQELSHLREIADNPTGGVSSGWASNALCFHYGVCKEAEGIQESSPKGYTNNAVEHPEIRESQSPRFRIIPNPSEDYTQVIASNNEDRILRYMIFDMNGREVLSINGSGGFDAASLPNGVYFCRVTTLQGATENLKFIVNH